MIKALGWIGMTVSLVSYLIIVNGWPSLGVPMSAVGCMVYGYYAFRARVWNLLVLQGVFFVANMTGIVHLLNL